MLFGAGWWFWVDAVACSSVKIPFAQYLPGLVATFALVMVRLGWGGAHSGCLEMQLVTHHCLASRLLQADKCTPAPCRSTL